MLIVIRSTQNIAYLHSNSSNNTCDDGDQVNSKLKLNEFRNTIINIPSPHNSFDNAGEVVICENDIRSFLCNICSLNSLYQEKCQSTLYHTGLSTDEKTLKDRFQASTFAKTTKKG